MKYTIFAFLLCIGLMRSLAADEPLIPAALNAILPKIHAGMTIREVEAVLAPAYPKVKGQVSNWSGGTGYIDYKLDERYSLSVSSITRDDKKVVHDEILFYLYDWPSKRRLDLKVYEWEKQTGKKPSAKNEFDTWSAPTNGLQARLTFVEKPKLNGTRLLVPFLELKNVRDLANQMDVQCDSRHLKIELVDADGKVIRDGWSRPRSGPVRDLSTVILPFDSSIRISLECRNWGVPKDAAAMVSADSGAWVIQDSERGRVYLRATLTGEKVKPYYKTWHGRIQTPLLAIDWK